MITSKKYRWLNRMEPAVTALICYNHQVCGPPQEIHFLQAATPSPLQSQNVAQNVFSTRLERSNILSLLQWLSSRFLAIFRSIAPRIHKYHKIITALQPDAEIGFFLEHLSSKIKVCSLMVSSKIKLNAILIMST